MDSVWTEFRHAPTAYFLAHRTNTTAFANEMLQVVSAEDKSEQNRLTALGILQEKAYLLFSESDGFENAVSSLTTTFSQQRNTAPPLVSSQILCTITCLLIEMEPTLKTHEQMLVETVNLLFDVIEKVRTDSNRLVKSVACECLRELEMAYPGLLSSKVGHFYGMSQAENSYIHQNYMALFSTVLEHAIQKFILEQAESSSPVELEQTLTNLLSYAADPLKSFNLPENFREHATQILKEPPLGSIDEDVDLNEVKRAVSFLLDHSQLMTSSCLATVTYRLISSVQCSSLSPKMLKSLMLQYCSSLDIRLFHLVLLLRLQFGNDICDEGDDESLQTWLHTLAFHPSLPNYQRTLLFQWMFDWPEKLDVIDSKEDDTQIAPEKESQDNALLPSVFDSLDLVYNKLRILCMCCYKGEFSSGDSLPALSDLLVSMMKIVDCGIEGAPVVTLYRILYIYYTSLHGTSMTNEISRLLLEVTTRMPKIIPYTIDFLNSVRKQHPESPLVLAVLAEFSQQLASVTVHPRSLSLYLSFLKYAATHPQINPSMILQILCRLLTEGNLCAKGDWEAGTSILDVCNTVMRLHKADVFKELVDLLQLMSREYRDLDIQDRSRFYHQLLLTVSGGKLSAILTLASDTATGSSLSEIVEARISNAVFPSAPPVRRINTNFLSLERVESDFNDCYKYEGEQNGILEEELVMRNYLQALQGDRNCVPLTLQYRIRFCSIPDGVTQRIYALVLKFSSNGPYHPSPDIYITYLATEVPTSLQPSTAKVVNITFYPKEPVPTTFTVSAIFTTEDGVTCTTNLPKLVVRFEDLFQPVPVHLCPQVSPSKFFTTLWQYIDDSQQQWDDHRRLATVSATNFAQGEQDWEEYSEKLQGLLVPLNTATGQHGVMVFVAPRYHLLLQYVKPSTLLIATDNWTILPLIMSYLKPVL